MRTQDVFLKMGSKLNRHLAFVVLSAPLLLGGCAHRPAIVDRPISFSDQRVEMTLDYIESHYGLTPQDIEIIPRIIVLHWTAIDDLERSFRAFDHEMLAGRPDLSAAGQVNVSIQFLVGRDGTIYRLMPENWMARHVIGLNYSAIGVENVGGEGGVDNVTDAQIEANIQLVRYLAEKYPTIEYLIGHAEYQAFDDHPLWLEMDPDYRTSKVDPGERFMDAVRSGVADLGLKSLHSSAPGAK
ncbi:MAG TPA: peptidoglycan recognition family protein [Longimicrobiaceae bacterium]|nr:peptidoglycan recognition family protein [Longimicrobiaceae bacterium]